MENVLRFEHPEMLYWLILIPVLVIIYILVRLWQDRTFKRFADMKMREYLVEKFQLEGFTKVVGICDDWTEVTFNLNTERA